MLAALSLPRDTITITNKLESFFTHFNAAMMEEERSPTEAAHPEEEEAADGDMFRLAANALNVDVGNDETDTARALRNYIKILETLIKLDGILDHNDHVNIVTEEKKEQLERAREVLREERKAMAVLIKRDPLVDLDVFQALEQLSLHDFDDDEETSTVERDEETFENNFVQHNL